VKPAVKVIAEKLGAAAIGKALGLEGTPQEAAKEKAAEAKAQVQEKAAEVKEEAKEKAAEAKQQADQKAAEAKKQLEKEAKKKLKGLFGK
jgi:AsmA protein